MVLKLSPPALTVSTGHSKWNTKSLKMGGGGFTIEYDKGLCQRKVYADIHISYVAYFMISFEKIGTFC